MEWMWMAAFQMTRIKNLVLVVPYLDMDLVRILLSQRYSQDFVRYMSCRQNQGLEMSNIAFVFSFLLHRSSNTHPKQTIW